MTTIDVRAGLRRLDFIPTHAEGDDDSGARRVIVEFSHSTRLTHGQIARINLGRRDGLVRTLEGLPILLPSLQTKAPHEFLYRLEGNVG